MAHFDLNKYQTVQQRIDLFWERYPEGRFNIEIISLTADQVVMKAEVWTEWERDAPTCVDYAEERPSTSGVNKTSHIENCATSVLGRAISQLGKEFSPSGMKPSREEMQKVERINQADVTNYSGFAAKLASEGDLDGLRALYTRAEKAGVSAQILKDIADTANGLKKS
jgi:hypothetical protein